MPGSLSYKGYDPNYQRGPEIFRVLFDRGKGYYYHRGHGQYSKYSTARDAKKKSTGWETNIIGLPKSNKLLHISDGWIKRR
jgi:hypothetical protein